MPGSLTIDNLPILTERYFTRQRESLVDGNIYDRGDASVPYQTASVRFRGQAVTASPVSVGIYLNDALQSTVTTDASGNFTFSVRLRKGRNRVSAKLTDGSLVGDVIFLNAYTFNTFFQAYAGQFSELRDFLEGFRQDLFLDDGTDLDGDPILISAAAMRRNFGQYVSGRKVSGQTRTEYRDFLKHQFWAYYYATTIRAFDELALAYTGVRPTFRFLKNTFFARPLGADTDDQPNPWAPYVDIGNPLNLKWNEVDVWMYRRWYRIDASQELLDPGKEYWVYIDGAISGLNNLEVKFMEINLPTVDYPLRTVESKVEVIPQADIKTDTDGSKTGIAGTRYVRVERIPISLTDVAGSTFGNMTNVSSIIGGTGWISLGVRYDPALIGSVAVTYDFRTEPRILARVTTQASIASVEFVGTIRKRTGADGSTSGMWAFEHQSRANEFIAIFPNYYLLAPSSQNDFLTLAREVKPSHKKMLIGDNVIAPSQQFPFPISAELGATTRLRVAPLAVISAELGATSYQFGGADQVSPIVEMTGELGASFRERADYLFLGIASWISAATQISDSNRELVRAAIRPSNGRHWAFVDDRYLYLHDGSAWGTEEDIAGAAVGAGTGDIAFQQSGAAVLSYYLTGDGLYTTVRPATGSDVVTEIENDGVTENPVATGRKGVAPLNASDFAVAYAKQPGADEELYYKVYSGGAWGAAINLGNPGGTGTPTFGDTLVARQATTSNLDFLCAWKGASVGQEMSAYFVRSNTGTWELVYDRATVGREVDQLDFVAHPTDTDKAYAVFRDRIIASGTTDAEIRFVERDGTWGTSVLLSSTNQGAKSPSIAIDEKGNLYVTYVEYDSTTSTKAVWIRTRKAGGTEWSEPQKVADSLTSTAITDDHPKSTHLAKKAPSINYGTVCAYWGDKFGAGASDIAVYRRCGLRGL